jgi:hypothetical protein
MRLPCLLLGILGILISIVILLLAKWYIYPSPNVAYSWVYIKANGDVTKGTVDEYESWRTSSDPRNESDDGDLPENGLLLTDEEEYTFCSRHYRFNNEFLYIGKGNDDFTQTSYFSYRTNTKRIAWWDLSEQLHYFKKKSAKGREVFNILRWFEQLTIPQEPWFHGAIQDGCESFPCIREEIILDKEKSIIALATLRKKFKQDLNIKNDKWETCHYWF